MGPIYPQLDRALTFVRFYAIHISKYKLGEECNNNCELVMFFIDKKTKLILKSVYSLNFENHPMVIKLQKRLHDYKHFFFYLNTVKSMT